MKMNRTPLQRKKIEDTGKRHIWMPGYLPMPVFVH